MCLTEAQIGPLAFIADALLVLMQKEIPGVGTVYAPAKWTAIGASLPPKCVAPRQGRSQKSSGRTMVAHVRLSSL